MAHVLGPTAMQLDLSQSSFLLWAPLKDGSLHFTQYWDPRGIPRFGICCLQNPNSSTQMEIPSLWWEMEDKIVSPLFWRGRSGLLPKNVIWQIPEECISPSGVLVSYQGLHILATSPSTGHQQRGSV